MEVENICQSCGLPLNDPELLGTQKDGSKAQSIVNIVIRTAHLPIRILR